MQRTINRALRPLGMRLQSQNLNDRPGGRKGPMWKAGRARLWLRQDERGDNPSINLEWHLGRWRFGLRLTVDPRYGDDDFTLAVSLPGISLYLSPDGVLPKRIPRPDEPHAIGVSVHDGGLWWDVWQNDHSGTPKWRHGHFDPVDWLLGRTSFSRRVLRTAEAVVPMPERGYPAMVSLEEHTWRRPRWPFPRRLYRADIEVEGGVPVPGKGESDYDCGEDAIFSMTCLAHTPEEAVGRFVESTLTRRQRYGGRDWRPAEAMARS